MSKAVLFVIVGLVVVTEILARSADKSASCGKHGDSCSVGCCNGFTCNAAAGRCMVTITADMLKEQRAKLKPVQSRRPSSDISSRPVVDSTNCGKHGDSCSQGCCNGFTCNSAARKCMATITGDMLKEQRKQLKPVRSRIENEMRHESRRKQHDSDVVQNYPAIGA